MFHIIALIVSVTFASAEEQFQQSFKQALVVCNSFADARPVQVGEKLKSRHLRSTLSDVGTTFQQEDALHSSFQGETNTSSVIHNHKRHLRHRASPLHKARFGKRVTDGYLWTRSLAYGTCDEYYVDFATRSFVFQRPGLQDPCEFKVALGPTDSAASQQKVRRRFAAVITRPLASSPSCMVVSREVPLPLLRAVANNPVSAQALAVESSIAEPALPPGEVPTVPSELVLLDAYIHSDLTADEQRHGLDQFSRTSAEAVVRIEDELEPTTITAETVSSRTLTLDNVYSVDARKVHMVLQDLEGNDMYDRRDIELKPGRTYVGVRLGVQGEAAFPQRLLFFPCEHMDVGTGAAAH